jgi:tetratricopeptide (TPR) repeat protein
MTLASLTVVALALSPAALADENSPATSDTPGQEMPETPSTDDPTMDRPSEAQTGTESQAESDDPQHPAANDGDPSESTMSTDADATNAEATDAAGSNAEASQKDYAAAMSRYQSGDLRGAQASLESLLSAFPNDPAMKAEVRTSLARVLLEAPADRTTTTRDEAATASGKTASDEALSDETASGETPSDASPSGEAASDATASGEAAGSASSENRNRAEALRLATEATDIHPTGEGFNVKGRVLLEMDRHDEAIAAFERAVDLDDENLYAMNNLGYAMILEGKFEAAREPLEKARDLASADAPGYLYNNLGIVLEKTGELEAARDAYQTADERGNRNAAANLERVREKIEDRTETTSPGATATPATRQGTPEEEASAGQDETTTPATEAAETTPAGGTEEPKSKSSSTTSPGL